MGGRPVGVNTKKIFPFLWKAWDANNVTYGLTAKAAKARLTRKRYRQLAKEMWE